ncbi:MAG: hypothetical protein JWM11_5618 [Planctomycetaceae bacterium]|nr:hypothetical protein [Planctomycetaceae bacterium]
MSFRELLRVSCRRKLSTPNECAPIGRVSRCLGFLALCVVTLLQTGCSQNMHRRMTIKSDPPGALVLLEGEEVGYTPVGIDFTHYGTREITLIKDGYETVTAMQKIRSPWYQTMPLDLITDNFSPVRIKDNTEYTFTLNRQEIVSNDQLLQRAKGLRSQAQILPKSPGK